MGRPRLPESERRNWTHSVNFFEGEYRAIGRWCEKRGIAIAKFLRDAAVEKLERDKVEAA